MPSDACAPSRDTLAQDLPVRRAVTADTDLCLTRYLGLSEGFFLGQADHNLMAQRRRLGDELVAIEPRAA